MAARDPILGLNEAFAADARTQKVNLGVGVYCDDNGKIPLLDAVRQAEASRTESLPARGYLPIDGLAAYNLAVQTLLFGQSSPLVSGQRVATVQALGGTGALKVGADLLKRFVPEAQVWISDPSWENHQALFESAGFTVNKYPYYDPQTHGVRYAAGADDSSKRQGRRHDGAVKKFRHRFAPDSGRRFPATPIKVRTGNGHLCARRQAGQKAGQSAVLLRSLFKAAGLVA